MGRGERENPPSLDLKVIYSRLLKRFGPQGWWPAESPFEVFIGAILTQRTNWKNVEKAIMEMKRSLPLEPKAIAEAPSNLLQGLIRSAGFYRQKADRLKAIASHICRNHGGSLESFLGKSMDELRRELLSIKGIGPETADSIILYAANKMIFPVDAYLRRILRRLGLLEAESLPYDDLRKWVEGRLPKSLDSFKEFRALIVKLAKEYCLKKPRCQGCPLRDLCAKGHSKPSKFSDP
jgi:endonuclease-3 related protein